MIYTGRLLPSDHRDPRNGAHQTDHLPTALPQASDGRAQLRDASPGAGAGSADRVEAGHDRRSRAWRGVDRANRCRIYLVAPASSIQFLPWIHSMKTASWFTKLPDDHKRIGIS